MNVDDIPRGEAVINSISPAIYLELFKGYKRGKQCTISVESV